MRIKFLLLTSMLGYVGILVMDTYIESQSFEVGDVVSSPDSEHLEGEKGVILKFLPTNYEGKDVAIVITAGDQYNDVYVHKLKKESENGTN